MNPEPSSKNDDKFLKGSSGSETIRLPLPEKFGKAMERAMGASENMLMERNWKDEGLRYGGRHEVSEVVVRNANLTGHRTDKERQGLRGIYLQPNDQRIN